MNYLEPRQREHDKRWDYTSMNDGQIIPVGYCRRWTDLALAGFPVNPDTIQKNFDLKDKFHTHGHETAEEAAECYRQYLLDWRLQLGLKDSSAQRKCDVCGEWTQLYALVDHTSLYHLCEKHNNREEIEKLYDAPGWIISS